MDMDMDMEVHTYIPTYIHTYILENCIKINKFNPTPYPNPDTHHHHWFTTLHYDTRTPATQ